MDPLLKDELHAISGHLLAGNVSHGGRDGLERSRRCRCRHHEAIAFLGTKNVPNGKHGVNRRRWEFSETEREYTLAGSTSVFDTKSRECNSQCHVQQQAIDRHPHTCTSSSMLISTALIEALI
jgi:hypothetical protein